MTSEFESYTVQCRQIQFVFLFSSFYPTVLKGCRGIVFTCGVQMGGQAGGWVARPVGRRASGESLSGLYLGNRKV